jgi:uncharacterized membrane protein
MTDVEDVFLWVVGVLPLLAAIAFVVMALGALWESVEVARWAASVFVVALVGRLVAEF